MELSTNEAILRLFLALALGSVVGLERELSHQTAGLRTHLLVCLGATTFTLVSICDMNTGLVLHHGLSPDSIKITHDPARIAAQIVTGIGFIGGGAVLRHGTSVRGLTTAASLWMMASIGMLIGVGQYYISTVATFFSFLVLFTIGSMERNLFNKHKIQYSKLKLSIKSRIEHTDDIYHWLEQKFGHDILEHKSAKETDAQGNVTLVTLSCVVNAKGLATDVNRLSKQLSDIKGVVSSSCKVYQEETPP